MGLSRTVSEINEDFCWKSYIWQCARNGTKWPVSGGCKITTYLESQTRSFYYTYNFHPATMMIKGSLLSDTAIVKYFQTPKKIQVHPSDRLHFLLEFHNHMWW